MHASRKCCIQYQRKLCLLRSLCMCESGENELKANNINGLIQLFNVYISWKCSYNTKVYKMPSLQQNRLFTVTLLFDKKLITDEAVSY